MFTVTWHISAAPVLKSRLGKLLLERLVSAFMACRRPTTASNTQQHKVGSPRDRLSNFYVTNLA
jgi:hypothetical protein